MQMLVQHRSLKGRRSRTRSSVSYSETTSPRSDSPSSNRLSCLSSLAGRYKSSASISTMNSPDAH
jgi:hypothetical protein